MMTDLEDAASIAAAPGNGSNHAAVKDSLSDFSTDSRVLLLSAMALPIGGIGALAAWSLLRLIRFITCASFFLPLSSPQALPRENHLGWWLVLVPVVGGLIVGLMARYGSEKIRGHGIPEALEAILLGRSKISLKVAILKPLSAALSIGTGGPFGAEGPIIMTGGAFGSLFARPFNLTSAERKTLLVAGAAAGMSAVFATPVAAVLLAVELLLFEWKPRSFIPVSVAAIVASLLRIPLLGSGPIFPVALHVAPDAAGLLNAALIGLLAGFASGLLTLLVYSFEDLFLKLPVHWMWWPAIGGVFIGVGGMIQPRVLGVGYDTIQDLLHGDLLGRVLLILLITKAVVWAIALGSGTSGGVLAPLLIMGGALGALASAWFHGDAGVWALLGMAAMMGGTMRSPLTAMIFAVELTHDFNQLPALMISCVAAYGVTVLLMRRSILTEKLARRGQHITREYSIDFFELTRVGDVMDKEAPTVTATTKLSELSALLTSADSPLAGRQGTLLLDAENRLAGIITRGDILRAMGPSGVNGNMTALDAGTRNLEVTFPDEPLRAAIHKMLKRDVGRLPVVDRDNPRKVIGYLGRGDVLSARMRLIEEESVRQRG
jgi:H+/Cl- antiporter ClcA/CBS domain-containing protein